MQSFGRVNSGPHDMDVMLVLVPTEGGQALGPTSPRARAMGFAREAGQELGLTVERIDVRFRSW
jgi:hypothetical protein